MVVFVLIRMIHEEHLKDKAVHYINKLLFFFFLLELYSYVNTVLDYLKNIAGSKVMYKSMDKIKFTIYLINLLLWKLVSGSNMSIH